MLHDLANATQHLVVIAESLPGPGGEVIKALVYVLCETIQQTQKAVIAVYVDERANLGE